MSETCRICSGNSSTVVYRGVIRLGQFGNWSKEKYTLSRCNTCGCVGLPPFFQNHNDYYESDQYRQDVDGSSSPDAFFSLHDPEQAKHLEFVGIENIRGKVIADVGCGGGAFLDCVKGVCREAIAIEPSKIFASQLSNRAYRVFDYADNVSVDVKGEVELATCFSVIEHVENPLQLLLSITSMLCSGGELVLSTPNALDILLELLPEAYGQFFYRKVHLWYFDNDALRYLLIKSGLVDIEIIPYQRFGMSNLIHWVRDCCPKGNIPLPNITPLMDEVWKQEIERQGRSDYLFVKARKP